MKDTLVDLRSDTVTRPTPAMREAMANAPVGDDVLDHDPTTRRLEERVAEILGKEAALFFPSGVQANQTAVALLSRPGTEVILEAGAHIFHYEEGAGAVLSGAQLHPVPTSDGLLTPEKVKDAIRPGSPHMPLTSVVAMENTHNSAGGKILPLEQARAVAGVARDGGLAVHLDGARLWHAAVATGHPPADWAALADTVMVCLSKGLGAPVGSLLAGSRELMDGGWRIRRRLGGGMRQSGILAAAGLHALDHHMERLAQDHHRARRLAEGAARVPGLAVVEPDTNIVMLDIRTPDLTAARVLEALRAREVLMVPFGPRRIRAVTHLDVDDEGIGRALAALEGVMEELGA